jgi:septum formation protein
MLVLASASPRREELLRNAGLQFVVQATQIDEDPLPGEGPRALAERLAKEKAAFVAVKRRSDYILGADTVVVVEGAILGKPLDRADAARMLKLLSGRSHQVITGVCLMGPMSEGSNSKMPPAPIGWFEDLRSETTSVTMTQLREDEVDYYVSTGEPMDKAGGYAIQGIASRWITRIEGDYSNVVGLPIPLVHRMLVSHGLLKNNGFVDRT